MQYRSHKLDFCLYQTGMKNERKQHNFIRGKFSVLFYLIIIGVTILFSALPASGQYMVQPSKLDLLVKTRTNAQASLMIHNMDPNQPNEISLHIVELSQSANGEWLIYNPDPNDKFDYLPGFNMSRLSSCSSWITLETDKVVLEPYGDAEVDVDVKVPGNKRGFYGAGILCSMRVEEGYGNSQVPFILRILVPVLVQIQGRPERSYVEPKDIDMKYDGRTTVVTIKIDNEGQTYPRLLPMCRIWALASDGHYRLIETHEFNSIGIIPGAKLALESDIGRSLPSGNYKIIGGVYVDGKTSKTVEKIIDFKGDPTVRRAEAEAPLDLTPIDVIINTEPGSSRYANLEIHNASDEKVHIQGVFGIPRILSSGVGSGRTIGDELICSDWLRITPEEFTLDSYATRRVRIIAEMPESAVKYSNYYALLGLHASYPDGQVAGTTTANVCVANRNALVDLKVEGMPFQFKDFDSKNSQYLVTAQFKNLGLVHIKPTRCRVGIVDTAVSAVPRVSADLGSMKRGTMLPFETRDFSEVVDISSLPDGRYRAEVVLEYERGEKTRQLQMTVSTEGGMKVPRVEYQQEQLPDIIEVQW
jgi:hypothetical protein